MVTAISRRAASSDPQGAVDHEFAIVGAGFGGLGVAIELRRRGIENFVVLEKAADLGGTWRDNTYPGLQVDVPSFTYCYHFAIKPDWSQVFAPGHELKAYADRCADRYGLRPHLRFGCRVVEARFDPEAAIWHVRLAGGELLTARYVVSACGYLSDPKLPDIDGFGTYKGKVMHTAAWDHDYDLTDKRVAIIGTGATAIQLAPAIADRLAHLDVYQRTAIWLAPKPNPVFSERTKRLMRRIPAIPKAARACNWVLIELFLRTTFLNHKRYHRVTNKVEQWLIGQIRKQVHDPVIQEKLIPKYSFFCKRPSLSSTFYPLFNREDVDLVTDPIDHLCPTGIVTTDGTLREVDVVVCATGFRVFDRASAPMFEVIGESGANLRDWWDQHRYQAYLGTSLPGFPNFFLIFGPYAGAGASYFDILNNQVVHISRLIRAARKRGANYVAVKQSVHDRDFRAVQRAAQRTVLQDGNCATSNTYYLDRRGDSPSAPRPSTPLAFWIQSRIFRLDNYRFEHRARSLTAESAPVRLRG